MTNQELKAFIKIVDRGSFSLAADDLYTSQSALSQQMKKLENSLGFDLFDHEKRRVKLTRAGENFYVRAKEICEMYRLTIDEGVSLSSMYDQDLIYMPIGFTGNQYLTYWMVLLRKTVHEFTEFMPRLIWYENRAALYDAILQGTIPLSLQMENADIRRKGLDFVPLTSVREICHPFNFEDGFEGKSVLTVEDLYPYSIAFQNLPGEVLFEDLLSSYVRMDSPQTKILYPPDYFAAEYQAKAVYLIPAPQFTHSMESGLGIPIDFGENIRLGFVVLPASRVRSETMEYIECLREFCQKIDGIWEFETFPVE